MKYFRKLFAGRLNRRTFFVGTIIYSIALSLIVELLFTVDNLLFTQSISEGFSSQFFIYDTVVFILIMIPFAVIGFSLMIRRLHDLGASGWFSLLYIIANLLVDVVLALLPGQRNANKYGKPPKPKINIKALLGLEDSSGGD